MLAKKNFPLLYSAISLSLILSTPIWAAAESPEPTTRMASVKPRHSFQEGEPITADGYSVSIVPHATFSPSTHASEAMTDLGFTIHTDEFSIGSIQLQYYPGGGLYPSDEGHHLFRVVSIDINEGLQQRGYGTQALNLLLRSLQEFDLSEHTSVWLEYNAQDKALEKWYPRFGFQPATFDAGAGIQMMRVSPEGILFPEFKVPTSRSSGPTLRREDYLPFPLEAFYRGKTTTERRGRIFRDVQYEEVELREHEGNLNISQGVNEPADLSTLTAATVTHLSPSTIVHVDFGFTTTNFSNQTTSQIFGYRFTPNPDGIKATDPAPEALPQEVYAAISYPINERVQDMKLTLHSPEFALGQEDYAQTVASGLCLILGEINTIKMRHGLRSLKSIELFTPTDEIIPVLRGFLNTENVPLRVKKTRKENGAWRIVPAKRDQAAKAKGKSRTKPGRKGKKAE